YPPSASTAFPRLSNGTLMLPASSFSDRTDSQCMTSSHCEIQVKASGLSLYTVRSSQFDWDERRGTKSRHWLGGQAKGDSCNRIAATDSYRNLGRAPARVELLLSEVEGWSNTRSSHEANLESAST